jgi:RimJ/RimL family protein N-acetyltransferase
LTKLPLTRTRVSAKEEAAIRSSVRTATGIPFGSSPSRLAQPEDAAGLYEFLSYPAIHGPIYNLPRPLTVATVQSYIERNLEDRARGEGLLFLRFDRAGSVLGYSEFGIWPEWGAGDLGGAIRADHQGKRVGVSGAKRSFTWMFQTLHLKLIVSTGALDNVRTVRMLGGLGFERKGEITNTRPDGSERRSIVWELMREDWFERHPEEA